MEGWRAYKISANLYKISFFKHDIYEKCTNNKNCTICEEKKILPEFFHQDMFLTKIFHNQMLKVKICHFILAKPPFQF